MTMMMTITNKPLDCFCVITIDDCVRQKAFVSLSAKERFLRLVQTEKSSYCNCKHKNTYISACVHRMNKQRQDFTVKKKKVTDRNWLDLRGLLIDAGQLRADG